MKKSKNVIDTISCDNDDNHPIVQAFKEVDKKKKPTIKAKPKTEESKTKKSGIQSVTLKELLMWDASKPVKKAPFGHKIPTVLKPRIAKLAKEYGGVTRLANALELSQSLVSRAIYTDTPISDRMAKAIEELTEGKLSFNVLKKMHIVKASKAKVKVTKKPVKKVIKKVAKKVVKKAKAK